jgi:hypothetical protein
MNFFRSEEHLARWWEGTHAAGAAATLREAFILGAHIFGERLVRIIGGAPGA